MKKINILAAALATAALSIGPAQAAGKDMEKCKVTDSHGHGLIKAHKGDCAGAHNTCSGHNKAGDADAWILVPKGDCDKINHGDLSGVSDKIKAKIDVDHLMKDHH